MNTLFEGTSEYYSQYRPEYPQAMFEDIVTKYNLGESGRLLDIGCGPGVLAIPLSKYFEEVVAVDIDSGMIKEGKERADALGINNIKWLTKSADELESKIGIFKLITLGASFHWLNRPRFCNLAFKILSDDGGMFLSWTGHSIWNKERNVWEEKVLEIIKKYLGDKRRAGNGVFEVQTDKNEDTIKNAGFSRIEFKRYPSDVRMVTVEDIIKGQYTTSYAAKNLFGDRAGEFEKELSMELLKINPDNQFEEVHSARGLYVWKR
jgi:ubiquinone/menaquinone biosynthesis C-methylase UbiE